MTRFQCNNCKQNRPIIPPSISNPKQCLRCKLWYNKVMLHKIFKAITEQPEMKEFQADMEQWYV